MDRLGDWLDPYADGDDAPAFRNGDIGGMLTGASVVPRLHALNADKYGRVEYGSYQ